MEIGFKHVPPPCKGETSDRHPMDEGFHDLEAGTAAVPYGCKHTNSQSIYRMDVLNKSSTHYVRHPLMEHFRVSSKHAQAESRMRFV